MQELFDNTRCSAKHREARSRQGRYRIDADLDATITVVRVPITNDGTPPESSTPYAAIS
jgi:hypothetical protein